MLLEVGQTYAGRYRITRKLGEGAMGAVYEAEHTLIRRRVALKVLLPGAAELHGARHRFAREAQAAGRIGSPHIVEVLDMGDLAPDALASGAARFIVMELLEGETLAERLRARGRLLPEEAAPIACQVLAGLGAAHAVDIVHRDLKPANVFLVRGRAGADFVKILDFGVSKFNAEGDLGATAPGAALGTPFYMSPEQAKGAPRVDLRADLYSVGVMLYECVTGQVPFDAGTFNELIFRIVLESPPPIERFAPGVDAGFIAVVHKAMAREPAERWASAREMHDALAAWLAEATGKVVTPGVVPWGASEPFVPRSHGASPARGGASTEMFDRAPTVLFVPKKKPPWRLIAVIAGAAALLATLVVIGLLLRAAPSTPGASATVAPSAGATEAPPGEPSSPAAPSSSVSPASSAPAITTAAGSALRPATKKPTASASPTAPPVKGRTVPSDL